MQFNTLDEQKQASHDVDNVLWQNSLPRAYLNGYNLHSEIDKGNGNKNFKASENFDFTGKGFIEEAFDMEVSL